MSHDIGQSGLSQSRRPVEEHMVKRLPSHEGGLDEYFQIGDNLLLTGEIDQFVGADYSV